MNHEQTRESTVDTEHPEGPQVPFNPGVYGTTVLQGHAGFLYQRYSAPAWRTSRFYPKNAE